MDMKPQTCRLKLIIQIQSYFTVNGAVLNIHPEKVFTQTAYASTGGLHPCTEQVTELPGIISPGNKKLSQEPGNLSTIFIPRGRQFPAADPKEFHWTVKDFKFEL